MTKKTQPLQTRPIPPVSETLPKPTCCKVCATCQFDHSIKCCLNCAHRDALREFSSFKGLAEDDWRGRMFAPRDTVGFYCNLDRTVQERKVPIADLPQVCPHWKPRFYRDNLTNRVKEKIAIGGEN